MREYEITYLISDDLNESEITKATGRVSGLIDSHKGKVLKEETWGRRKLAYPIKKQTFATYITVNFEMEGSQIKPFERELFLSKEIIRHLLILKDFGKETLELTAEDIAKTSEIEEVVGGEKSFEAVEGQTEDSYELMAKREEKAEETQEEKVEEKEEILRQAQDDSAESEVKAEEPKEKKTTKKSPKADKTESDKEEKVEEAEEEKTEEKPKAKKPAKKKAEKAEDEADRLAKLNQEIEDILGDDL